jgi:DNA-binding NarL/FixJ family response regulator
MPPKRRIGQIAAQLHLSVGTVKGYVSAMFPKIQAGDRTQAALFAVRHGLEAAAN